jgi:hypothetical protein
MIAGAIGILPAPGTGGAAAKRLGFVKVTAPKNPCRGASGTANLENASELSGAGDRSRRIGATTRWKARHG